MQTNHPSRYQTHIAAPIEKVWDALVNPEIVKHYFFGSNLQTDWQAGSSIFFTGEYEGNPYQDKGIVQEYIPHQKLKYTYLSSWSGLEDKPENYLYVMYEVKPEDRGTLLTITQSNYSEEKISHSEENWAMVIDGLKKMVE